MALIATQGVWMPAPMYQLGFNSTSVIDATGEKIALMGRVWNKDRATKNLTKVGFRFGTITKAGGSGLTVSHQNVDLANGPVIRPDGTPDGSVAIANANANFASNTWIQTGAFDVARSVAFGELIAIVVEYDGSGRQGADSVVVSNAAAGGGNSVGLQTVSALFTSSWAAVAHHPNLILEFDDGSFGTFMQVQDTPAAISAVSNIAYNSGSAADEVALQFTVPFPCKLDGAWVSVEAAASADFDIVLYEGTTAKATVSVDSNAIRAAAAAAFCAVPFAEVTLAADTIYYLAFKPTTANNITIRYFEVAAANHFQAHPGGTSWKYNTRVNAGAWGTATDTRRPYAGICISALDDGTSTGGGMLVHPGMNGRLSA